MTGLSTMRTVTLEKTLEGLRGSLPVGETYTWTFVSRSREKAEYCAKAALRRDYPGERSEDWTVRA